MADNSNIGVPETHDIDELHNYHRNPRTGNVDAIKTSMQVNGVFRPIIVNRGTHTGREMEVLAGNHSLKAMRELAEETGDDKWLKVDCWVVDVDDDRASRIVLADNRTADLGGYDNERLIELLTELDYDLDGTGYDYDDLEMLKNLEEHAPSLEELEAEHGAPETDDFWPVISIRCPHVLFDQWRAFAQGFDDEAEALEHLLDHGAEDLDE